MVPLTLTCVRGVGLQGGQKILHGHHGISEGFPSRAAGPAEVQLDGQGLFQPVWLQANGSGELTVRTGFSDDGAVLSVASLLGASVGPPKTERPGQPHCLRLDLDSADSAGHTKHVMVSAALYQPFLRVS